ncbi:ubiquitin-like protein [Purpureocillium lavendulum]|uniref:Ubiquitin-like protein n=1 Tax=Purpureocillium lavendulum TaxID=1247861 RepID=A0AB34FH75_9HYPO|nr:ubiquitin-like protein [Purpureocillium lavendulum]
MASADPNWRRTSMAPRAAVGARVALDHPHPHHQQPHQHDDEQHQQQHAQHQQQQAQPYLAPTSGSRFRKLRGKSVSSPRAIDVFRDSPSSDSDEAGGSGGGHLVHSVSQSSSCYSTDTPRTARRRSKSVTAPRTNYYNNNDGHNASSSNSSPQAAFEYPYGGGPEVAGAGWHRANASANAGPARGAATTTTASTPSTAANLRGGANGSGGTRPVPSYRGTAPTSGALSPKPVNVSSVDPSLAALDGVKPPPVYRGRETQSSRPRAPVVGRGNHQQQHHQQQQQVYDHGYYNRRHPGPNSASPQSHHSPAHQHHQLQQQQRQHRQQRQQRRPKQGTPSRGPRSPVPQVSPVPQSQYHPGHHHHQPQEPYYQQDYSPPRDYYQHQPYYQEHEQYPQDQPPFQDQDHYYQQPDSNAQQPGDYQQVKPDDNALRHPLAQEQFLSPPPAQQYETRDLEQRPDGAAKQDAPVADAPQPKEAYQTPRKQKQQPEQWAKQASPAAASAAQDSPSAERQHYQQDLAPESSDRRRQRSTKQVRQHQQERGHQQQGAEEDADRVAEEVARLEAETDRILAEQKKLDLLRLQATLETPPKPKRSLLGLEKLFISRGKKSNHGSSQPSTPDTLAPSIFSPALSHFSHRSSVDDSPIPFKMGFIEPGGKDIVPQTDAPASASNGGERVSHSNCRVSTDDVTDCMQQVVMVRSQSATVNLPISADTSPDDIIQAVAQRTKQQLSTASFVVIECYFALGLERRLRRYERVRDTLNSWDNDQQNSLLIMPVDSPVDLKGLELSSVPRTEDSPSGFCVQLYHSSRPGKWAKRWVTLLESGQMFVSKKPHSGPADKDSTVICHLSDFDLYNPKQSEMRRSLKPPKRLCYAIKSQQKTIVFPNGENFVHFFCTDDEALAARFCELVHGWRSWYLANLLVDLERKNKAPVQANNGPLVNRAMSKRNPNGTLGVSIDKNAEPLWDVTGFKSPDINTLTRTLTLASKDRARAKTQSSPSVEAEAEFAAGGLLGSAYDKRQAEAVTTSTRIIKVEGPFTEGPSLLNGGVAQTSPDTASTKTEPQGWFPSAAEHTARLRAKSNETKRPMTADAAQHSRRTSRDAHYPAPLLSFADKDRMDRHSRYGEPHGYARSHQGGGQPLINFATGGQAQQPHGAPPQRGMSRRGLPPSGSSSNSLGSQQSHHSQHSPSMRGRSRSTASSRPGGGSRRYPDEQRPPMPQRSVRHRDGPPPRGVPPPGQWQQPGEPLVNRAR